MDVSESDRILYQFYQDRHEADFAALEQLEGYGAPVEMWWRTIIRPQVLQEMQLQCMSRLGEPSIIRSAYASETEGQLKGGETAGL